MDEFKVLVADGTTECRSMLCGVLGELPNIRVVGTAGDGKTTLEKVARLAPHVVLLDVDMSIADELDTLRELAEKWTAVSVVMVCPPTQQGIEKTTKALQLGAFDFFSKPVRCDQSTQTDKLKNDLRRVFQAFTTRRSVSALSAVQGVAPASVGLRSGPSAAIEAVAIGVSTGGPNALAAMLPELPADLGVPVLIVQHMPSTFTGLLASMLDRRCLLRVVEGCEGLPVEKNIVYLAPGGMHMRIRRRQDQVVVETTLDPPEQHSRPSVNYLFRSVAEVYGARALGVIMTGMGFDGTEGLAAMKAKGSYVLAQDERSSIVFGMPGEAAKAGLTDEQVPLEELASRIVHCVRRA